MGVYKDNLERSRINMSEEEKRRIKNSRKREAHKQRREANRDWSSVRPHLSPAKQLAKLDERLGVGVGAVKERKKLNKRISQNG